MEKSKKEYNSKSKSTAQNHDFLIKMGMTTQRIDLRKIYKHLKEICKNLKIAPEPENAALQKVVSWFIKNGMEVGFKGAFFPIKNFGFIRHSNQDYVSHVCDAYVSNTIITKAKLQKYQLVTCVVHNKANSQFLVVNSVLKISKPVDTVRKVAVPKDRFEAMEPIFPYKKIDLHMHPSSEDEYEFHVNTRLIDIFSAIGFGQRLLVAAPPKSGKTILIKSLIKAISNNHPEAKIIVFLVDERPEEITDFKAFINNMNAEVVYSSFDSAPKEHITTAESVFNKCKKLVLGGADVVLCVDSLTKLCKSYNNELKNDGKIMPGGISPQALSIAKKLFGLGRQIKDGGSLTIIGTAIFDSFSKSSEIMFEELKGVGNAEIFLDRSIAEQNKIYPPIHISKTGTRREEKFCKDLEAKSELRAMLSSQSPANALSMVIQKIKTTTHNEHFLQQIIDSKKFNDNHQNH